MEQTSTIDAIRENLRLQQTYNVMLRYGLDILFTRLGIVSAMRRQMQRWVWNLPDHLDIPPLPARVRLLIKELGPTYVKVGQILSSQASVIPPEWEAELAKLQSDVPAFPAAQVRRIILQELKAPPEQIFAAFEQCPLPLLPPPRFTTPPFTMAHGWRPERVQHCRGRPAGDGRFQADI